ncbi:MAG: ABC transporter substrate-binding protein [Clostridia bacterium]|nr:ABC transporter substrate-binding protein [Clostridia bacterium]
MKKLLAYLLICVMALTAVTTGLAEAVDGETAAAEKPQIKYDYDELTVAVVTPLTGNFFTNMWGNGSSDMDVRAMIHGYNLIEWDTDDGMFVPDESVVSGVTVQAEENGDVTFIIALYEDMVYSDGTPVTAWDYAFSMLLTMAPEMQELGGNAHRPEYIAGYSNYINGKTKELTGVRVLGDHLMHITIDDAYLPFFYELGLLDCTPYPISVIAPGVKVADDGKGIYLTNAEGGEAAVFTADLLKRTILDEATGYRTHPSVTSGPYMLTSYEEGVAKFEINPKYKGNSKGEKPLISKITLLSMPSEKMVEAYQNGDVTLLNKVSDAETISTLQAAVMEDETQKSANYARTGLSFISFNTDRAPLDDLAVRQAMAYAADRDKVEKDALGGYGKKGIGYFGLGQWMYLLLNGTVLYPVPEPGENATAKEKAEYEQTIEKWEELSLDDIEPYDRDLEKAAELLDGAGWNLNENDEVFVPGTDKVRYKQTEEGLVPLRMTLAYGEGSAVGEALQGTLAESLAEAGIELAVEAIPADDLLEQYYRQSEARYDMFFLATNFDLLYDPSLNFIEDEDGHHVWKSSGLADDELWELAVSMRRTESDDLLGYCTKWLDFQKCFAEKLPLLPMYSNVYFDFYPRVLHAYNIGANVSWPQAILDAYLSDYIPVAE